MDFGFFSLFLCLLSGKSVSSSVFLRVGNLTEKEKTGCNGCGLLVFFFSFPVAHNCLLWSMCLCVCACLYVCVYGVWVGVHTHACTCQLAECRPWRLFCSMTCTRTEMTKIPFIAMTLCVSPSYSSLWALPDLHHPVIASIFILYFFPSWFKNGIFGNLSSFAPAISISHHWPVSFLILFNFFFF